MIGNPIVVDDFPFRDEKDDYLLWIGRLDEDKGPHRAIAAARAAGVPLVLARPVQPGKRSSSRARSSRTWTERRSATSARWRGQARALRRGPGRSSCRFAGPSRSAS